MDISEIIYQNHKAKTKIYPVVSGFNMKIEVIFKGVKKTGSKEFTTATINNALIETHKYYFEKLTDHIVESNKKV